MFPSTITIVPLCNNHCSPVHSSLFPSTITIVHTYIHTYIHAYMHTCIHAYILHVCLNIKSNNRPGRYRKAAPAADICELCLGPLPPHSPGDYLCDQGPVPMYVPYEREIACLTREEERARAREKESERAREGGSGGGAGRDVRSQRACLA